MTSRPTRSVLGLVLATLLLACRGEVAVTPTPSQAVLDATAPAAELTRVSPVAPDTATALAPTPSPAVAVLAPENLSAGDPYAPELGNAGYDVQRYTLHLALAPGDERADGWAVVEALSAQDDLRQVSLDFAGFEISAVTVDGSTALYARYQGKLLVTLPRARRRGEPFLLKVVYGGAPLQERSRYVPFVSHLGLQFEPDNIYVVAEPDGARYWFPANDHPRDKALFRFEILVPPGLTGVANGHLVETQAGIAAAFPDGRAGDLWVWEHASPMATALATVAVGDYVRVDGQSPHGVKLRHYVFPEQRAAFERQNELIGEAIDWMSQLFGPYPFEEFGYLAVKGLGASLETQSMVIYGAAPEDEVTLVHEMAHMWFGDWVSLNSWGEIWRNEGFATYVPQLWDTRDDWSVFLDQRLDPAILTVAPSHYPLGNPPPERMFDRPAYDKGALLAHALRKNMGDEAFLRGLRGYFARYGGAAASQAEFQAVMESAADKSLQALFDAWLK